MTELPALDPTTGFVPTLNRMGGMSPTLDPYSAQFAAFAGTSAGAALDVGAAYGVATLAALEAGGTVIANDLEPRHLEILASRVPDALRSRLTLKPGAFPADLALADGSLGCVLLARMLHFLDGPTLARGLDDVFRWLAPGGQVYGVAVTPWLQKLQPFRATYEARVEAGELWPGIVTDVPTYDPVGAASLPDLMHFLTPEVISRALTDAGFEVVEATYFSRADFVGGMKLDGRETLGFIARKPG